MKIVARKLDKNMNGPQNFAIGSEQELIEHGYVWDYNVFQNGNCVRTGYSKIETLEELEAYIRSGLSRLDWEAGRK